MATLVLSHLPDEVLERLTRLAEVHRMSVEELAEFELARVARRADKAVILASLPTLDITTEQVVDAVRKGREERMAELDERLDRRSQRRSD